MSTVTKYKITKKNFRALGDTILITDMEFKERIINGIIIPNDDMKSTGIRPRWGKVYAVGKKVLDILPEQYILVSHGRWSRGMTITDEDGDHVVRKVDPKDVLIVSDEPMDDTTFGIEN